MNAAPAPTADAPRTILYPRRYARKQRGKALMHLVPAVVLLSSILEVVSGAEPLGGLRSIEFAVGAAYLLLLARELRHLRHHPHQHEPVAWLELAVAGILGLEGCHLWHRHHEAGQLSGHPRFHVLPWLYLGLAGFYVGLAFGLRHVLERRFLNLPAAVEAAGPADLVVMGPGGARAHISFARLHDGPAQRDRLLAHAQAAQAAPSPTSGG